MSVHMRVSLVVAVLSILALSAAPAPAATLNSEEFVAIFGSLAVTEFTDACNSTTPCGPGYQSCAGWSSYTMCNEPWCAHSVLGCGECGGREDSCEGPALQQQLERYRVCFNSLGESCTEYQPAGMQIGCGC